MTLETLTCAEGHAWEREKKRGTKPKRCPAHAEVYERGVKNARSRRLYAASPDNQREASRQWRQANPERAREYDRAYSKVRPDKKRAAREKWLAANRDARNEWQRGHRKANPEMYRADSARYRARRVNAPDDGSNPTWRKVADRDGMECAYCPTACVAGDNHYAVDYPTLDHVVPLSKGGAHSMNNAVLACRKCNCEKRDMVI